jgi:hypothetical protein
MSRQPEPEDREWYDKYYEAAVANAEVRSSTMVCAARMRSVDDPEIQPSDVLASRAYLRKCMTNMSMAELATKSYPELAALWARGALGAARYRSSGGGKPRRRRRGQEPEPDD